MLLLKVSALESSPLKVTLKLLRSNICRIFPYNNNNPAEIYLISQ